MNEPLAILWKTLSPRGDISAKRSPFASGTGLADRSCFECSPKVSDAASIERHSLSRFNRMRKKLADGVDGIAVPLNDAFSEAVRIIIIKQRRADVIGTVDHDNLLAFGNALHNGIEIRREGVAVALADIGQQTKQVVRAQSDRQIGACPVVR